MADDSSENDHSNRKTIKIIPRNLTAFAAYSVPGNPAITRPESGVEVSFPGLEIDQRTFEQRFFPGLYFEIHREDGVVLADVELKQNQLASGLARSDLSPQRPIFLLGILCKVKPTDKNPQFFSFYKLSGREIGPRLRDLLPGRLAIIFGPSWETAVGGFGIRFDTRLNQLEKAFNAVDDADKFIVERDNNAQLTCGIFSDNRTAYLDHYGVIDTTTFPPGDLTKTLCAPWIYDFRDCLCFYWASNKPDITDGTTPPFLNYLRDRDDPTPPPPSTDYQQWIDQRMSIGKLISGGWRTLPAVINDREERRARPPRNDQLQKISEDPFALLDPDFNRDDITNELRYLATVEHALIVEYLFAHYSLDAPISPEERKLDDDGKIVFSVAADLLQIAIDEMRHFLWVNELLRLLNSEKPSTNRASIIGLQPDKDPNFKRKVLPGFTYLNLPVSLRTLSLKVLDEFIDIEANSRNIGPGGKSFGMYVQILASLMRGDSKLANTQHAVKLVKLLVDEGDQHGVLFQTMKERLQRVKGDFKRDLRQEDEYTERIEKLLKLADTYYFNLLELIHVSFGRGERAGGDLMRDAVALMIKLHEVGHKLANQNVGLRFTEPEQDKFDVPGTTAGALEALNQNEERLMSQLTAVEDTGDAESKGMAQRQKRSSKRLYRKMRRTIEEDK